MSTKTSKYAKKDNNTKSTNCTVPKILLILFLAAALRYVIISSKYQALLANHVEVSTPLNSWKRVSEGIYLLSRNINPYDGDLLHETPLSLWLYKSVLTLFNDIGLMFITFDIFTGLLLFAVARKFMTNLREEHSDTSKYAKDVQDCLMTEEDYNSVPLYVLMTVLFNPFTLLGCVGYSTVGIHNFFLAGFLCSMVYGSVSISSAALAICTSISLYPSILVVPCYIYFLDVHKSKVKAVLGLVCFAVSLSCITGYNSKWGEDFSFVKNVYGCILTVPDLEPNIGLFWYFFTEMFDHFRDLFIYSFQINATILYLIPLSLKFRKQPFLLTFSLLFLVSVFKSYPSVSDLGFALSLLPNFLHLFPFCQQGFLVGVIFLITSCLAPILWYLWIYCNSANANFYFGVTLAFAIAQIFLLTDILFAQIKREFTLKHGKERKINGEEAVLSLE